MRPAQTRGTYSNGGRRTPYRKTQPYATKNATDRKKSREGISLNTAQARGKVDGEEWKKTGYWLATNV